MHLEHCECVVTSSYVILHSVIYHRSEAFAAQLYLHSSEVHSVLTGQERNHRVIYVRKDLKIIESHRKETAVEEKALCIPVQIESMLPILTFFSMKLPFTWKIRH